jgi:hypothetical protein
MVGNEGKELPLVRDKIRSVFGHEVRESLIGRQVVIVVTGRIRVLGDQRELPLDRNVFVPVDRHIVVGAIAAEDRDIIDSLHGPITVGNHQGFIARAFLSDKVDLADGRGSTAFRNDRLLRESVGHRLILIAGKVGGVGFVIHKLAGLGHLIERDGDERRQIEEEILEVGIAVSNEFLAAGTDIEVDIGRRIAVDILCLGMHGLDPVQRLPFPESEVIAIRRLRLEERQHVLLGQGREEQTELDFVIPVEGMEEDIELRIAHRREIGCRIIVIESRLHHLLNLLIALLNIPLQGFIRGIGFDRRLTGEGKVRCGIVGVDQIGLEVVVRTELGDIGM